MTPRQRLRIPHDALVEPGESRRVVVVVLMTFALLAEAAGDADLDAEINRLGKSVYGGAPRTAPW